MATLTITKQWANGAILLEADLDYIKSDVETFLNTTKINDDNIQNAGITASSKLIDASISAAKLATGAVTTAKILDDAVTTAKILDANVTYAKLAAAVTSTLVPPGSVWAYGGTSAPSGWLLCDGSAISRATYSALFTAISTTYGAGDTTTTFNIPDIRGRVIAGQDDMGGTSANRLTNPASTTGGIDGDVLGGTGGSETHALTSAQQAEHTHGFTASVGGLQVLVGTVTGGSSGSGDDHNHSVTGTTGTRQVTVAATAHNVVQPTIILNYIIKT